MTRVVLRFLADYRDQLYRDAFMRFIEGRLLDEEYQRFRGQFITANDVVDTNWDTICEFYGCPELQREEEKES